jgi:hypothetical protein
MAIVLFENAFEGMASSKLAINAEKVISVFQVLDPLDKKKKRLFTAIYAGVDLTWTVKDPIEEVIKKLNDNPRL